MRLSHKQEGHLLMFCVMAIFGLNIPVTKYLYSNELISPIGLVTMRMAFATFAFWVVSLFMPKEEVARKDLFILLIGGVSGMLINQGLFAYGLQRTTPVDASIITTSSPLFALIIAAIILKEPITMKKAGGVLIGGAGAIFLVYTSHQHIAVQQDTGLIGDLSVLGAQLFYSFYIVITRPLSAKYSPVTMMKWMFLFSSVIAIPSFYNSVTEAEIFVRGEVNHYLTILFVLVGGTFITYLLIPLAQRRIRATTISMYNNVQPLVASTVAIIIGQDNFTWEKLFSAVLIFSGVYLVTTSKSRQDLEKE